ncbi:MAG TPA: 16S rRNA (guanine(527)-N(7))-methyltransferase RsmG [Candidatus Angelobacter sp.]|nr:16S rRNA (guanine(527)-N(7))-methyltransferase RsmG [Candidatus Angelobacter sp.]
MDTANIARLLQPFIQLDEMRLAAILKYIDLLLKWNARINLTAIRAPEEIVERHFGESFFAAKHILARGPVKTAIDLGSGAGFPGVPFALLAPQVEVTLIESSQKKSTFLKELIYSLELRNVKVFSGRAESYSQSADLVMLRAVEKFEEALPLALQLVSPGGSLALMIGTSQVELARSSHCDLQWQEPLMVPSGHSRVLLIGTKMVKVE